MEHSTHIKRNTQPISKGILILLKGTQRNTHIIKRTTHHGILILLKGTQRNTHIIKRNSKEHSYYQKELKGTLIYYQKELKGTLILNICGLEDTLEIFPQYPMRATWISTISSKTISSPATLLLPLVTWNSHHHGLYIYILKYFLSNYAFCLMCHIKPISGPGHPRSPNWTLDFYFPLSPRSLFPTRQRFPFPNHVTSGCMSLRSLTGQRFPISKTRDFRFRL